MKQLFIAALLATTAVPASAGIFDLFDEFSEESQNFLEKWGKKIGPSLEAFGPQLDALLDKVDDWTMYELPEILDNGDIIMRRKTPRAPDEPTEVVPENPSIEL